MAEFTYLAVDEQIGFEGHVERSFCTGDGTWNKCRMAESSERARLLSLDKDAALSELDAQGIESADTNSREFPPPAFGTPQDAALTGA